MVTRILKTASVTNLRDNLQHHIENLQGDKTLMVLKHNEAVAFMLSPDYFEELLESIERIQDIEDMLKVMEDFYKGENLVDGEELLNELGL